MEPAEIATLIEELEDRVDRLRALYEQYFMGMERIEPTILRKEVDRRLWVLRREQIRNTGVRFRLQMIVQRYNTFQQYWQRICREIENGTYTRDLGRAAERFGAAAAATTAIGRRRQKMFERGIAKRAERDAQRGGRQQGESASSPPSSLAPESVAPESPSPESAPASPRSSGPPSSRGGSRPSLVPAATRARLAGPSAPPPRAPPRPSPSVPPPAARRVVPSLDLELEDSSLGPSPDKAPAPSAPRAPGAAPPPGPPPFRKPPQNAPPAPPARLAAPPGALPAPARPAPPGPPPRRVAAPGTPPTAAQPANAPMPASPRLGAPPPAPKPPAPAARAPEAPLQHTRAEPPTPTPKPAAKPVAPPAPAAAADGALSEARLRQIYGRYVEAKRQCNESTAATTFEKVAQSLRKSEEQLRAQHKGRKVDFDVVVKDGKPMLKPVIKG